MPSRNHDRVVSVLEKIYSRFSLVEIVKCALYLQLCYMVIILNTVMLQSKRGNSHVKRLDNLTIKITHWRKKSYKKHITRYEKYTK